MSNAKTASVREVQHGFSAILDRVKSGEVVTVTRRGEVIARIVPASATKRPRQWPDFEARAKRLFPNGPPPGKPASEIIRSMRDERL